ncbi:MAG: OsmC family protein [Candidatus Thorarchaeota archaeon]|jgi:uncharacterized OsmC-like protein
MSDEHNYSVEVRTVKPMFMGVTLKDMEEFEVTSAPDWWPESPPGFFSPQTMFLAASASCYGLSLYKAARAIHTQFKSVSVEGYVPMLEEDGVWRFDSIQLKARIVITDEAERGKMKKASELAHKSCPIRNSLKSDTQIEYEIVLE